MHYGGGKVEGRVVRRGGVVDVGRTMAKGIEGGSGINFFWRSLHASQSCFVVL